MYIGAAHFRNVSPFWYLILFLIETVAIRLGMSTLRTWQLFEERNPRLRFKWVISADAWPYLWDDVKGRAIVEKSRDFLVPMLIGIVELIVYPFLIALGAWQPISGWLVIKTAAGWRWEVPRDNQSYMRFLLGNGLSLIAASALACLIRVRP